MPEVSWKCFEGVLEALCRVPGGAAGTLGLSWGVWRDLGSVPWGPWSALVGSPGGLRGLEGSLERWEAFWEIIGVVPEPRFPLF